MDKTKIIEETSNVIEWWLETRAKKLLSTNHKSMEVNPFMAPIISALHGFTEPEHITDFLVSGHFLGGHNTGFGKLIDEKLLPKVFGTTKLDAKARTALKYVSPCFNDIDHVVQRNGKTVMVSLKASRWTIQLSQAKGLNSSFSEISKLSRDKLVDVNGIIVGVLYGSKSNLSDKYDILRGINRGANHDVLDVRSFVNVLAGREFWAWLGDDLKTQEWVMEGILTAISRKQKLLNKVEEASQDMEEDFSRRFPKKLNHRKTKAWVKYLKKINS